MVKFKYLVLLLLVSFAAFGQIDKKLGIEYFNNQEYDKALTKFSSLYQQSPTDEYYHYILDSYLELKQLAEAEKFVKKHIKKNSRRAFQFYVDLGYVQLQRNKQIEAQESFEMVYKEIEKNPNMAYQVSQNFTDYGYYKEALVCFERSESKNPGQNFEYQKALIYADMGDIENMYKSYLEMLNRNPSYYNSIITMLRQSVKSDPESEGNVMLKKMIIEKIQKTDNIIFNNLLVWLLTQEKSYNAAFVQLKALDRRMKRNQSEIYHLGNLAAKDQDYISAEKCYNYILQVGEVSAFYEDALMKKAFTHKSQIFASAEATDIDYTALIAEFEKVLEEINYPEERIEINKAIAEIEAYKLGNPEKAISLLTTTLAQYKNKSDALGEAKILLADIVLAFGDPWEALVYYAQVDKAFGDNEIGQEARFKKAMVAFYEGDFDWAKTQFDVLKMSTSKLISNDAMHMALVISDNTFLDTDSNFTALKIYARAKLLIKRQDLDSALVLLEKIEKTYPAHSLRDDVLWERAQIEITRKQYDQALVTLNQVVDFFGSDLLADRALFEIAKIYDYQFGDIKKAMSFYQKLFSEHADSILASQARERFRTLRGDELYN